MKTIHTTLLFVAFTLCCTIADDADATYVQPTTNRVADGAFEQYALVKISTTANRVTKVLHTDAGGVVTGVAQKTSAGAGVVVPVQELQGLSSHVVSDGTGAIAAGDLIDRSSTVDGRVMKAPASPAPDGNTICTALTAAAAVAGTVFTCL